MKETLVSMVVLRIFLDLDQLEHDWEPFTVISFSYDSPFIRGKQAEGTVMVTM